jgi:hypothetical protein
MSNDQSGYPQNPGQQQPPAYPGAPTPPQQQFYPGAAPTPPQPVPPQAAPGASAYPGAAPASPVYPGAGPSAPAYPGAAPAAPGYAQGAPAYGQPYGQPYPTQLKSNGLAIASLICGIASVVLCWAYLILPLLAGVPAVIMGHIALKKIKRDPALGGKGLALTGLITGYAGIGLGLIIGAFLIFAIFYAVSLTNSYGY